MKGKINSSIDQPVHSKNAGKLRQKRSELSKRINLLDAIPLKQPFTITVENSAKCNFKCNFCLTNNIEADVEYLSKTKNRFMPYNIFKKIIDDISDFPKKLKALHFVGFGESTLDSNIYNKISYAQKAESIEQITLLTNGSLLSKKNSDKLIETGIDRIYVSIYGLSTKEYKENTNTALDFNKFIQNIEYLYKNKTRTNLTIKAFRNKMTSDDTELMENIFSPISDDILLEDCIDLNNNQDLFNNHLYIDTEIDKIVCDQPFYVMPIDSNGNIKPCGVSGLHRGFVIGNVRENGLKDLWNSKVKMDYIKQLLDIQSSPHFKENDLTRLCENCNCKYSPSNEWLYKEDVKRKLFPES